MKKIKIICLAALLSTFFTALISAQTPTLSYSTIIGGSSSDYAHAITVNENGNVTIAGQVASANYPTTAGAFDRSHNGGADILVSRLSSDGSQLDFSTYIGGAGFDDTRQVHIDETGCTYLTGSTSSANFPVKANSLQGSNQGYFLILDENGDSLKYSSRWAGGEDILKDSEGNIIIMGSTNNPLFPTTDNAYCRVHSGNDDVFVAKINISTNTVIFSTFIGGSDADRAPSMALDSQDNIIIAGLTASEDFPVKGNAFAVFNTGKNNVFVIKLKSDGTDLIYSTTIGGNDDDWPFDIAVDIKDCAYITGGTRSGNFPVTTNSTYSGNDDAFLLKLSSDGSNIIYSSYFGGSGKDGGRGVAVDISGKAYFTGCTTSTNFPVTTDAYDGNFNGTGSDQWAWGDPFLAVINPESTGLEYSTYLGGTNDEEAYGIAIDKKGGVYLSGITTSSNFPTTAGVFDRMLNGSCDCYIVKFQFEEPPIDYLGQTTPGNEPEIFAPGIVSVNDRYEYGLCISPAGDEIYFTVENPGNGLMVVRKNNGIWGNPILANLRGTNNWEFEAFFTPDGNKLFFTSDTNNISKFWFMEKINGVWTNAKYLESPVNNDPVMWCTFTSDETMYYGNNSNWKICKAKLINGEYSGIDNLGFNGSHPSIAPDESFFLFNSSQYNGFGNNDILIVFKNENGEWTTPINPGNKINTSYNETCASLSPDGKYIFFGRYDDAGGKSNIYWVSSSIIDSIKQTLTDVTKNEPLPTGLILFPNYPNPFNPVTIIRYLLSGNSNVKLRIYDTLGQEIKTLVDSFQNAGEHSIIWDGMDDSNNPVSSGIYLYRIQADRMSYQKKMVLLR